MTGPERPIDVDVATDLIVTSGMLRFPSARGRGRRAGTMNRRALLLSLIVMSLHAISAHAAVIFSNVGPALSFSDIGVGVNGATMFGPAIAQQDAASAFSSAERATLDSIEVALAYSGGLNRFDILLLADDHGLPGSVLEVLPAIDVPALMGCPASCVLPLTVVTSIAHPLLEANTRYWVGATASGTTFGGFMLSSTGDTGVVYRNYGGPWMPVVSVQNTAVGFRVNGTPVGSSIPEPASVVLFATAAGALLTRRRAFPTSETAP